MSFEKNFCPSPWFHMRINNSGTYEYCRWKQNSNITLSTDNNIKKQTPSDYFQNTMSPVRKQLLDGQAPTECSTCYLMDQHNKVSGRQRQLLKAGVIPVHFEKSLASSPLRSGFDYSLQHCGTTQRTVSDWQIDLGNYCNGGCVYCSPEYSSKLAAEFLSLGLINQLPINSWCDDPDLLNKFIHDMVSSDSLKYLHFIGGETLITPGFKKILEALVATEMAKDITIGFTTNLTVWQQDIVDLLLNFKQINLGLSIETLTSVNDYVRWPSKLLRTQELLNQWVELGEKNNWLIQLRITPTCLTIHDLTTVFDYAWNKNISVESCNFLFKPEYMRISVLPLDYRRNIKKQITQWILAHPVEHTEKIVNTRNPKYSKPQIIQDAQSYVDFLELAEDESFRLPELVQYLKTLEKNRKNSILNYIPNYEQLLRSAGY